MPLQDENFHYSKGPCPPGWSLVNQGTRSQGCRRQTRMDPIDVNNMAQQQVNMAQQQYANMVASGQVPSQPAPVRAAEKGFLGRTWDGLVAVCGGSQLVAGGVTIGVGYYLYKKLS